MRNAGDLPACNTYYLNVFYTLSRSRANSGMGLNAIAFGDMIKMLELKQTPEHEMLPSVSLLQEMDSAFMAAVNKQNESKQERK